MKITKREMVRAFPSWLLFKLLHRSSPDHPLGTKTLRDWASCSTPFTRRLDIELWFMVAVLLLMFASLIRIGLQLFQ
jgi:hypothetical protein